MHKENQQGFTLIEVLVVMAIIAIMATMALPLLIPDVTKDQVSESIAKVERYKPLIQMNHQFRAIALQNPDHGLKEKDLFPPNNEDIEGMPPADKIIGNYISAVVVKNGVITLVFGNKAHKSLQGKKLSLQPSYVAGHYDQDLDWICGYSSIPDGKKAGGENETDIEKKHLPLNCR